MDKFAAICASVCLMGLFLIGISYSMDAAVNGVVADCTQLGGFRHEDKVYTCTQIRPNPIRASTHSVPLQPEFAEGGEETEQP